MNYKIRDIKKEIILLYGIYLIVLSVFSYIHFIRGDLKKFLPFFLLSLIGNTISMIYFFKRGETYKPLVFSLIFVSIAIYPIFLFGGISELEIAWIVLLFSTYYLLLPIEKANILAVIFFLFLTLPYLLSHLSLFKLPYPLDSYIPFFLILFIVIFLGNSVIRELQLRNQFHERHALYDSITGLYTRGITEEMLLKQIELAKRLKKNFSILLIDIDDFKKVNDTHGHNFGDSLLRDLGFLIKTSIRKADIAGRWGGEEFLIILPETPLEDAEKVAEKIRKRVERYFIEKYNYPLTVSIGVAAYESMDTIEKLIDKADVALYKAKRTGKNRVEKFLFHNFLSNRFKTNPAS